MATTEIAAGKLDGDQDAGVLAFRGIPFAQPPTGSLRFRGPRPVEPWSGVRDAREFGLWSPQNPSATSVLEATPGAQGEDCLNLNVWTPSLDGSRPVMVWIHGGGFTSGSGAAPIYNGAPLASRGDVVIVTINYRLGILGFLAHPDLVDDEGGGAAGNWGLLDQVAALRWVHENIAAFGGDPDNVTIFGESAGGMSVADLLAMPAATGLFHKAIVQSGPPNATSIELAGEKTVKLLAEAGLTSFDQLREVPVPTLLELQATVLKPQPGGGLVLVPVVDGSSMPDDPVLAIADGSARNVPLLIGSNRDEAKLFMIADPKNRDPDEDVLYRRIERAFLANDVRLPVGEVVEAYRAARAKEGLPTDPRELWSAIESDRMFRIGSIRTAEAQSEHQPSTFMYLFTWESPAMRGALGACHALELPFVFGTLDTPGMNRFAGSGPEADAVSAQMMDAWVSFARTGEPEATGGPEWPEYEPRHRVTRIFGSDDLFLEEEPFESERAVWNRQ